MAFLTGPSQRPLLESMEARILHSADIAPLLLEPAAVNAYALPDATRSLAEANVQRSEIVFVDASVPDLGALLADWQAQREAGRAIEVITIGADQDGLALISSTLAGRQDVAAVHVLGHGSDGVMQLGNTRLDAQALLARAEQIAGWGNALTADADLLLYGCDFAQTGVGQQLVRDLAVLTGADVAASVDLTGASALGGDWVLEYNAGAIEARSALSTAGQVQWSGVLATYNVTAGVADGDVGSLRWAITQANANSNADTINLAAGTYNLTITGNDDNNAKGDLDIREDVTLVGAGAAGTIINASAVNQRVFDVRSGTVVIQGVTITGGSDSDTDGGGVYVKSGASLTLTDVVIQGNVGKDGGGIYNDGTLTLDHVKLSGNTVSGKGGALHNASSATLTDVWIDQNAAKDGGGIYTEGKALSMTRVTVSNNSASNDGGGLYLKLGALEYTYATNITISGNRAGNSDGKGGGIYLDGASFSATIVSNATITNNSANGGGGGIYTESSGKVYLTNSILSANYTGANSNTAQASGGYNIDTDTTALPGASHPSAAAVNLGALADNGGFAPTHALLAGSAAINVGNPNAPATDQRGFSRVGVPDIGAYESQVAPNAAPVLSGSNNLASILEDAASNSGTLVSALIAGRVSDADGTATSGIAVTGVSNANGTWQFSVDGGSSWTAFISPSSTNARLLAANASTSVRFVPNANWNGTVASGLTFRAWDQTSGSAGGTANTATNGGSSAFSSTTASASITVTSVNDAPTGTSRTVSAVEDTAYVFSASDFGFSDPNDVPANTLAFVKITTLPTAGALTVSGAAVSAGDLISVAQINAGNLKFTPVANAHGTGYASFTFQVRDNGGTANGGVDLDLTPRALSIDVSAVNDAPVVVTPAAQDMLSNGTLVFSGATGNAIAVSDIDAGASSIQVKLSVSNGTLTLNGIADLAFTVGDGTGDVTMTFTGSIASINTALDGLLFTPSAGFFGSVNLTVDVDDLGNLGAPGAKTDSAVVIVNVSYVNAAPVLGAGPFNLADTYEDALADAGTSVLALLMPSTQVADTDPGALAGIAVSAVNNSNGVWQYSVDSGANWLSFNTPSVGASRLLAADTATFVRFQASPNWSGAVASGLTFRAWDQTSGSAGGTANTATNGGSSAFSSTTASASITVTSVSDAPTGTSRTVSAVEDTAYVFSASDFGFSDPNDVPSNTLAFVKITTPPTAGALTLSGAAVSAGDLISVAQINAGDLEFTPAANGNGAAYANFTFEVQDDGGTANGGVDLDPVARTMAIDVTPVNDAPTGTDHAVTLLEDGAYTFAASDFGFDDASDFVSNSFLSVTIATLPTVGSLTLGGSAVVAGTSIAVGNINQLVFTPAPDGNAALYANFTFQVQDDGGTANGGVDLDPSPRTMSITVLSVNDAPTATGGRVTTPEDVGYVFRLTDFGFSDLLDSPANTLRNVVISALPGMGELQLAGNIVVVGQYISASEIVAGALVFIPGADGNGTGYANFTFRVQDDGGTANGGVDLASAGSTMTIDVTPVNDAPTTSLVTLTAIAEDSGPRLITQAELLANASDVDGPSLSATGLVISSGSGTLSNNGNGTWTYTPALNDDTSVSFGYTVTDGSLNAVGSATLDITPVNDAPTISGVTANTTILNTGTARPFSGVLIGDLDSPAQLQSVTITLDVAAQGALSNLGGGSYNAVTGVYSFSGTAAAATAAVQGLVFTPAPNRVSPGNSEVTTFALSVNDGVAGAVTDNTTKVDSTSVNTPPQLLVQSTGAFSAPGSPLLLQLPAATFVDPDVGDALSYTATRADGTALPAWLSFNPATLQFTGTPGVGDAESVAVRVVATDLSGASASMQFAIQVVAVSVVQAPTVDVALVSPPAPLAPVKPEAALAQPAQSPEIDVGLELAPALLTVATLSFDELSNLSVAVNAFTTTRGGESAAIALTSALTSPADTVLAAALLNELSGIASSSITQILHNNDLLSSLEALRGQMQALSGERHALVASSIAVSSGLSIGYVIWLVRGGVLVSSMLSALPAWQLIDPLPVMATAAGKKRKTALADGDDPDFERLFDGAKPVKSEVPLEPGATEKPTHTTDAEVNA